MSARHVCAHCGAEMVRAPGANWAGLTCPTCDRRRATVHEIRARWSDPQYCERDSDEADVHTLLARIDELELQAGVRR